MNWNFVRLAAALRDEGIRAARDFAAHWRRRPFAPVTTLWPLWVALATLALSMLLFVGAYFDVCAARAVTKLDPRLVFFFNEVTQAGKSGWLFALFIAMILFALFRRAQAAGARLRAVWGLIASRAFYVFTVLAFSGLASQLIKHIVGRARPKLIELDGSFHFDMFSLDAVLASFPSGHTTTMFAVFGVLSLLSPRLGLASLLLAIPVAASRIIVGAHYPSDVAGGLFLGLASALIVARIFARRRITFTLKPDALLPEPRGIGLFRRAFSDSQAK